jgi:hypothetical protein
MVGAPACGDVMKLQIKVNPATGLIEDAKFKTYGCGSAIASSSLVTEWVKGKSLDEALAMALELRREVVARGRIGVAVLGREGYAGNGAEDRQPLARLAGDVLEGGAERPAGEDGRGARDRHVDEVEVARALSGVAALPAAAVRLAVGDGVGRADLDGDRGDVEPLGPLGELLDVGAERLDEVGGDLVGLAGAVVRFHAY